jgi:chloramphenicol 3-O-phosphotransferase
VADLEGSVFLLTGIPAAGKSTVADGLARRFARSVHVRGDEFRRMVVSGRVAMAPNASPEALAQLRLRYRLAAMTTDAWHEAGFTVVVQDVVVGPVLAEQVAAIASRPLYLVVLAPSPAVVGRREAARRKTGYDDGWSIEEFDAGFRATTPRIGLWIDSSVQTPDETVDEIIRRARSEALV